MTLFEARRKFISELKNVQTKAKSSTPELDADVIFCHFLQKDRTWITFHRDFELNQITLEKIENALQKRKTGLPVAYITNTKEFFGYDFYVTSDVLIPKPDTEILIELALNYLNTFYESHKTKANFSVPQICDMCTGSGCIGLTILKQLSTQKNENELPQIVLADISEKALNIAKINAQKLFGENSPLLKNLKFKKSNLFELVPESFNLIVTNPPYIPHLETQKLLQDGRNEPVLALNGDINERGESTGQNDGLGIITRLVPQCYKHLQRNGVLIMETGEYNAQATQALFDQANFRKTQIHFDLNTMMRDVTGIK